MSSPSWYDLFQQAGRTAGSYLNAWGVSQQARRNAEYQQALSETRQGFSELYEQIQRTPDYQNYETQFTEGAQEILRGRLDWIKDDWVRERFEAQFIGIQQQAQESVQRYAFQRERAAIASSGFNNVIDTHQFSGFVGAQQEAEAIMDQLYNDGMIGDAQRDQWRQEWKRQGAMRLEERLKNAEEEGNRDRVDQLIREAHAAEIITSEEQAMNRRNDVMHTIARNEATAMAWDMGVEEGLEWIRNPESEGMPAELDGNDRREIEMELVRRRELARAEERYQREETSRKTYDDLTDRYEGRPQQGLNALFTDEIKAALLPQQRLYLIDRWQADVDAINGLTSASSTSRADSWTMDQTYWEIKEQIRNGELRGDEGWGAIREKVNNGLLDRGRADALEKLLRDPTQLRSHTETILETVVEGVEDLSDADRQRIIASLHYQLPQLTTGADGQPITDDQALRSIFTKAAETLASGVRQANRTWFGQLLTGEEFNPTEFRQAQQQGDLIGQIFGDSVRKQALSNIDDDEVILESIMSLPQFYGRTFDDLPDWEKAQVVNTERALRLGRQDINEFERTFGIEVRATADGQPRPGSFSVSESGEFMFMTPDGRIVNRRSVDGRSQWQYYTGTGWDTFDPRDAGGTPPEEQPAADEPPPEREPEPRDAEELGRNETPMPEGEGPTVVFGQNDVYMQAIETALGDDQVSAYDKVMLEARLSQIREREDNMLMTTDIRAIREILGKYDHLGGELSYE